MNTKNLITLGIVLVVGVIVYKVATKEKSKDSSFSSACGACGG